jgi:hypothetical protein
MHADRQDQGLQRRSCDIATAVYFIEEKNIRLFVGCVSRGQNEPWYWSPNQEAAANEEEDRRGEHGLFQGDGKLADPA